MSKAKPKKIIPISDTHAAIGAGAIICFFVLWALIAGAGDDFVCWIGGKDNLSGWAQAIGAVLAIAVAIKISKDERENSRKLQEINEFNARRKDRSMATALIQRFIGTLTDVMNMIKKGDTAFIWQVQSLRVILESELELQKSLPLNELSTEERKIIFSIQIAAIQLKQGLILAESDAGMSDEGYIVTTLNSEELLTQMVRAHRKDVEKSIAQLNMIWTENNKIYR